MLLFDWQIAKEAEFFSFGTNDLTQMTFGYSRDDVGKFLPIYIAKGILQNDPFEVSAIFNAFLQQNLGLQMNWICICLAAGSWPEGSWAADQASHRKREGSQAKFEGKLPFKTNNIPLF